MNYLVKHLIPAGVAHLVINVRRSTIIFIFFMELLRIQGVGNFGKLSALPCPPLLKSYKSKRIITSSTMRIFLLQ